MVAPLGIPPVLKQHNEWRYPMSTQIVDEAAVERAYRTLAASISNEDFHRFVSQRTSGDDGWLEAA